jgi:hypothetical protein
MEQRRHILEQRLANGVDSEYGPITKDLIDPLMIPRIKLAFSKIENHKILNEGSK